MLLPSLSLSSPSLCIDFLPLKRQAGGVSSRFGCFSRAPWLLLLSSLRSKAARDAPKARRARQARLSGRFSLGSWTPPQSPRSGGPGWRETPPPDRRSLLRGTKWLPSRRRPAAEGSGAVW